MSTVLDLLNPAGLGLVAGFWGWVSWAVGTPVHAGAALFPSAAEIAQWRYLVPLLACLPLSSRPLRFGLALAAILAAWHIRMDADGKLLHREARFSEYYE